MKRLAMVCCVGLLPSCGGNDAGDPPDAALPVVAPVRAQQHLQRQIGKQNELATQRATTIDELTERDN